MSAQDRLIEDKSAHADHRRALDAFLGGPASRDAKGTPVIFWRGESGGDFFTVFDRRKTRESGFFFTRDPALAQLYAKPGQAPRAFYIRAPKVLDLTRDTRANRAWVAQWSKSFDEWTDRCSGESVDAWDCIKSGLLYDYEGDWSCERWRDLQASASIDFDMLIASDHHRQIDGGGVSCIVFDPHNIKSVDNVGSFDISQADMRFASHRSGNRAVNVSKAAPKVFALDDMVRQQAWIVEQAKAAGHHDIKTMDDLAVRDADLMVALAQRWRDEHPVGSLAPTQSLVGRPAQELLMSGDYCGALRSLSQDQWMQETPVLAQLCTRLADLLQGRIQLEIVPLLRKPDGGVAFGACTMAAPGVAKTLLSEEDGIAVETVLHEAVHAATLDVLLADRSRLNAIQQLAVDRLAQLQKAARRDLHVARHVTEDGLDDLSEFVAQALSCVELQQAMAAKPWRLGSLWSAFKSGVFQALGMAERHSMLAATLAAVEVIFEQPSVDRMAPQTESAAFKRWYDGAVLLDDATKQPLVVYHGTSKDFSSFRLTQRGTFGAGIYAASSSAQAEHFMSSGSDSDGLVMPLYMSLKQPLYIEADYDAGEAVDLDSPAAALVQHLYGPHSGAVLARMRRGDGQLGDAVRQRLMDQGYDGIVARYADGSCEYVAFHASQVKSALGNVGSFSAMCDDIRYRAGAAWDADQQQTSRAWRQR